MLYFCLCAKININKRKRFLLRRLCSLSIRVKLSSYTCVWPWSAPLLPGDWPALTFLTVTVSVFIVCLWSKVTTPSLSMIFYQSWVHDSREVNASVSPYFPLQQDSFVSSLPWRNSTYLSKICYHSWRNTSVNRIINWKWVKADCCIISGDLFCSAFWLSESLMQTMLLWITSAYFTTDLSNKVKNVSSVYEFSWKHVYGTLGNKSQCGHSRSFPRWKNKNKLMFKINLLSFALLSTLQSSNIHHP